jgi:hypothetical protein
MSSASPTANSPTATITMSIPLPSWSTPNVSRDCPVSWSIPTNPISSPTASEANPRIIERDVSAVTDANASSVSAK